VFPLGVDCGDQVRQRHVAICGEFVEPIPKGILNADARLVSGDQDRVYDDERFPPDLHFPLRHGERPGCLVPLLHDQALALLIVQEEFRNGRGFGLPFVRCLYVAQVMRGGKMETRQLRSLSAFLEALGRGLRNAIATT
jgi:hypothetical protein